LFYPAPQGKGEVQLVQITVFELLFLSAMGGFLGLTIVYTYAASGEVTELPIDIAWSFTNLYSGMGILVGPFFSGSSLSVSFRPKE